MINRRLFDSLTSIPLFQEVQWIILIYINLVINKVHPKPTMMCRCAIGDGDSTALLSKPLLRPAAEPVADGSSLTCQKHQGGIK